MVRGRVLYIYSTNLPLSNSIMMWFKPNTATHRGVIWWDPICSRPSRHDPHPHHKLIRRHHKHSHKEEEGNILNPAHFQDFCDARLIGYGLGEWDVDCTCKGDGLARGVAASENCWGLSIDFCTYCCMYVCVCVGVCVRV